MLPVDKPGLGAGRASYAGRMPVIRRAPVGEAPVRLVVDSDVVVAASANVAAHADGCRALATETAALGGLADREVGAGMTVLADVCADVLELVAIDLDLIAARMSAGAWLYSAVEAAAAGADPIPGP